MSAYGSNKTGGIVFMNIQGYAQPIEDKTEGIESHNWVMLSRPAQLGFVRSSAVETSIIVSIVLYLSTTPACGR
ncbi:hypothetical protein H4O18_15050 [Arenibacter sp. BSSL-BM3]|uniref:Uncharacterized protein n=1 Tax=Arenibacter arenosicollis TaxID=2762274 RepID=A0ABR7QQ69_9FLAO|nr:hypothetical protein [Arenibacter arenosicollis]MBC8769313.1 hypothetical protein [Arenibacter arenosicollis]